MMTHWHTSWHAPWHGLMNPRPLMAALRPVDGITIFTARDRVVTGQGSASDAGYLRLIDLAWDLRKAARQNGLFGRLSQLIVVLGSKPQLWINDAFRIEADSLELRYRVTRQVDDARETLLECTDPRTIVDFVMRHVAGPQSEPGTRA